MRFQEADTELTNIYMNGRVEISVRPIPLGDNTFGWRIKFQSRDGVNYVWVLPGPDLYSILTDLAKDMNQDVAIVIYEAICEWYNNTLLQYQMEIWPTPANDSNCVQMLFPPKENFRAELELIEIEKWSRLDPYGTSVADRMSIDDIRRTLDGFARPRDEILTRTQTPTITAWATYRADTTEIADCINYLTSDEYERKKADGELHPNTVYLVLNQN